MKSIKFEALNFANSIELRRVAEIHEGAPLNWNPNYVVREERIRHWCFFLKSLPKENLVFVLLAKAKAGEIVGLHWLQLEEKYNEPCAHIYSLWVSENYRRCGIGRELKCRGEEWAKNQGAKFLVTNVFYDNKKMIEYNLQFGFTARQVEMIKDL